MPLRDYFAAAALQGLCAGFATDFERWPDSSDPDTYETTVNHAFAIADAMLAAKAAAREEVGP